MTDHTDLIKRLEAASVPDRRLLLEAFDACYPEPKKMYRGFPWVRYTPEYADWFRRYRYFEHCLRAYAWESAALTLVPDDAAIEISVWPLGDSGCEIRGTHEYEGERWHSFEDGKSYAAAKTPALAICIAALKAQEQT